MSTEEWRPIPGAVGYRVSSEGRVWSDISGRLMTPGLDSRGRPAVCIDRRARRVHQLVAVAFLGPRPDGQEVRHLDGDCTNNRLVNLAYGTHSENVLDQVLHGTHHMARKTHCPQDHPYDEQNTYLNPQGLRECRECGRARSRAWKAKRAKERAA